MNQEAVNAKLSTIKYPGFSRDILSFGLVREIKINDSDVLIVIEITTSNPQIPEQLASEIKQSVAEIEG